MRGLDTASRTSAHNWAKGTAEDTRAKASDTGKLFGKKLELAGVLGMLLGPEFDQPLGKRAPWQVSQTVNSGVTGRAKRDEPAAEVLAGAAVVNMRMGRGDPAGRATAVVSLEHSLTLAGKAGPRAITCCRAWSAERGTSWERTSAAAEQSELLS